MTRQCSRSSDLRDNLRASEPSRRDRTAFRAWTVTVLLAAGLAFYLPALRATRGVWPAPLDDVYIHFDFAKSAALGHPFEWIVGNGYSSGGTSLTYPLVLAVGWAVGFRGTSLGLFAAVVALLSLFDGARSLSTLVGERRTRFLGPVLLVAIPLVDWTLFSGMEVAFALALMLRALAAASLAVRDAPHHRARRQLAAGVYLALLSVTRPECAALALPMVVAIAHGAGALGTLGSLLRAGAPTAGLLALQAVANLHFTGEASAAGALRKLITSNPYASGADVAALFLTNLVRLRTEGIDLALGGSRGTWLVIALALVGLLDRRHRRLVLPLLVGASGALALVCFNTTAPFQNMRYVVPTLVMLLVAAFAGLDVVATRLGLSVAAAALAAVAWLAAPAWPRQIDHFARASRNIVEQQVEVGRRLAALSEPPRRVFVGDAGAIPYVSGLPALDGLGLGGYRGLPFARASVAGGPAVLELVERLPPSERPDVLAVYDAWWPDLVPRFGHRMFDVRIDDNVICGDATKSVYRADWSLLEDRGAIDALDRLDVGDLVDERDHRLAIPGPHAGYVIGAVATDERGRSVFDAGRIVAEGGEVRFVLAGRFDRGAHTLALVDDGRAAEVDLATDGASRALSIPEIAPGRFRATRVGLADLGPGSTIVVYPRRGVLRLFSVLVER